MAATRKHKRVLTEGMDVYARTTYNIKVELLDISSGGACIRVQKRLAPGSECFIKLAHQGRFIHIKGTVAWEKSSGNSLDYSGELLSFYTAGIEFDSVLSELPEIMQSLNGYRVTHEQCLSGTRFKVYPHVSTNLSYKEIFTVKRLSFGGMLIESLNEMTFDMRLPLELFIPEEDSAIVFQGRVASCVTEGNTAQKYYYIGIEFLDIAEQDRKKLRRLLYSLTTI